MRITEKTKTATADDYLQRVNRVIDWIGKNLDTPTRLNALAKVANLSPFHFHRVFQAIVGETPADFIKRLRLEKALTLMATQKSRTLTEIALSCGFTSSSDFSRSFRQRYGAAPRAFDVEAWRREHLSQLEETVRLTAATQRADRLPARSNPDRFQVKLRALPCRNVAYIRVARPYEGDRVMRAAERLMAWASRTGVCDNQWFGYQWENPEVTPLKDCYYSVAVEADNVVARGEIGRYQFPTMTVAEVAVRGTIEQELRALQWLYGVWLPRSGYVPDDQPCFEAWIGRPFTHGPERIELNIQLPVKKLTCH